MRVAVLELMPAARPDGSVPTCFCHPPAMRVCRECTGLKQRIEGATDAVSSQLERDENAEPAAIDAARARLNEAERQMAEYQDA